MGKKLYIQQVKPFVELEVKPEGQEAVIFGFKAYGLKDREGLAEKWAKFLEENTEAYAALSKTQEETFTELPENEKAAIFDKAFKFMAKQEEFNLARLASDVLYIKGATVTPYDGETALASTKLADTRKAAPLADFWTTPEEALAVILESFLDDKRWKDAILSKHQEALTSDYQAEQAKN